MCYLLFTTAVYSLTNRLYQNAFSEKLAEFGFDLFSIFVVDFMHEYELGVWKSVFTHLLRILVAAGGPAILELNARYVYVDKLQPFIVYMLISYRYRLVPTFGRSTIRRFTENVSAMKKLAARNFEDMLQCAIPVFEGLLDSPHNEAILDLLFILAEWHTLAKLRMHTDSTVNRLKAITTELGRLLRRFQKYTCSFFVTKELPKEEAARGRRQAAKKAKANPGSAPQGVPKTTPKIKLFSLLTYKLHALGDYVWSILFFGSTDSYSTQPVSYTYIGLYCYLLTYQCSQGELEHRHVKRFYARTNKNQAVRQMTRLERREYVLRRMNARKQRRHASPTPRTHPTPMRNRNGNRINSAHLDFAELEALPYTAPEQHHHISSSRNFPIDIPAFIEGNAEDGAVKVSPSYIFTTVTRAYISY